MTPSEFKQVMNDQLKKCRKILDTRESLYATEDDRHDNFRRIAISTRDTAKHVLMDLVGKQWDALNVAVVREARGDKIEYDQWEEWITDIINYMLLLKGLVIDEIDDLDDEV